MKIFPAIDLRGGKAVRLTQGDYDRMTVYNDHPAAVAAEFLAAGATCTLQYVFAPTATGVADQELTVTTDAPGGGTAASACPRLRLSQDRPAARWRSSAPPTPSRRIPLPRASNS